MLSISAWTTIWCLSIYLDLFWAWRTKGGIYAQYPSARYLVHLVGWGLPTLVCSIALGYHDIHSLDEGFCIAVCERSSLPCRLPALGLLLISTRTHTHTLLPSLPNQYLTRDPVWQVLGYYFFPIVPLSLVNLVCMVSTFMRLRAMTSESGGAGTGAEVTSRAIIRLMVFCGCTMLIPITCVSLCIFIIVNEHRIPRNGNDAEICVSTALRAGMSFDETEDFCGVWFSLVTRCLCVVVDCY